MQEQGSDDPFPRFTAPDEPEQPRRLERVHCHLTYTNAATHELNRENIDESPMYSGQIEGRGPRYCPSIEDKVVRFADKDRHQIFVEPEGHETELVYPNGISTSLPLDVQEALVATIPGLERARIVRPGYAGRVRRRRCASPGTTDWRARTTRVLYFAGTDQRDLGLRGGPAPRVSSRAPTRHSPRVVLPPLRIERDQGYAGVLVDDLVTQGCDEPYRMFTFTCGVPVDPPRGQRGTRG